MNDCQLSGNSDYIASHLDALRQNCSKIGDCINSIRSQESTLAVLGRDYIKLNTICQFISGSKTSHSSNVKGQCTAEVRQDISKYLEEKIQLEINNGRDWAMMEKCLSQENGNTTTLSKVDTICRLAETQSEICKDIGNKLHATVQNFFTHELQDALCLCKKIHAEESWQMTTVYISVGAVLLFFLICLGIFCGLRKRKFRKKMSTKQEYHIYDELNSEIKQLAGEQRPSMVSAMSEFSTGTIAPDEGSRYAKLFFPEIERVCRSQWKSTIRDCRVVATMAGRPAGDLTSIAFCEHCQLEHAVEACQGDYSVNFPQGQPRLESLDF
uniref:Uncharacterized protein n=1 Tax=Biomphalaria glabrata TaxID=6526 RepID=A0A2C9L916_BIOGL